MILFVVVLFALGELPRPSTEDVLSQCEAVALPATHSGRRLLAAAAHGFHQLPAGLHNIYMYLIHI